jgi:hypothetical protein
MICTSWCEPVRTLVGGAPASEVGLWSLLQTGALAAAELSLLPVVDDDFSLTAACRDLHDAADELEWAHPHLPISGTILDLGPAPLDDVLGCRTTIGTLIIAALCLAFDLLDRAAGTGPDTVTLSRIVPLLASAQLRAAGRR